MSNPAPDIEIRPITAEATRPLRGKVLRPHQPAAALIYPGDDDPRAVHVGAFRDGALIGIASFAPEAFPRHADAASPFRLRGMATEAGLRGLGIGAAVLEAGLTLARGHGALLVWCNARVPAESFYRRRGFAREGAVFDLPEIGPHVLMWRRLAA